MTYFTKIQLISQGGIFADEVSFHFNRRWRRFSQIKDTVKIALPSCSLIQNICANLYITFNDIHATVPV